MALDQQNEGPIKFYLLLSSCLAAAGILLTFSKFEHPTGTSPSCPFCMQTEHMNISHWRKSGQFVGLKRAHVEAVLQDTEVYPKWVGIEASWGTPLRFIKLRNGSQVLNEAHKLAQV
jgi:hypothetical protein